MKTNEQMAADLQARGHAYQAARQRRAHVAVAAASVGAVACLALVVFASGIFRTPVPSVSATASGKAETASAPAAEPSRGDVKQYDTETDALPLPEGTEDVNHPILFAKEDVKGAQRGEAALGKATLSPALRALIAETEKTYGDIAQYATYVVTVDFSICFDREAASGFVYEGKTVAQYEEELQRYLATLPTQTITVTTPDGRTTTETTVSGAVTSAQKQELAARRAALTAAKAAYARPWLERIAARLKAAGWTGQFAGADSAAPSDAELADGLARTLLTAEQMETVSCGKDEGVLFLPATKINGGGLTEQAAK